MVGADATTLVIEDTLAGRVRQNSIQQHDTLFDNLRALGFTHLKYTNNFESDLNYGAVWTIKPRQDARICDSQNARRVSMRN
jgi:hypothetical protein